ncbi:hypothetical protein SDC9_211000 [bioreactor metagenome]|uniref:Uncharacterized protein n=1 Tax=bioreactor metagenome TaxID=1076179 RepID=A0A645JVI5_9ZZZZ
MFRFGTMGDADDFVLLLEDEAVELALALEVDLVIGIWILAFEDFDIYSYSQ